MAFIYDPQTGQYRDGGGRFVPAATIRAALDRVIDAQSVAMRTMTQQMMDGQLSLGAWQAGMMQSIKATHLIGLSVAGGGWNTLDQSDFGWVGQRIRGEYAYLRDFASQLASGQQPLNGTVLSRVALYAEAGRATHRAALQRLAVQDGMQQERNQLGAADHCPGCLSQTAMGWQPVGTLIPCGSRDCMSRCRCHIQYRSAPVMAMAA